MPLTNEILIKYRNQIFVETGTFGGDAAIMASKLGFDVYTIELDKKQYDYCKRRFASYPNIKLFLGDSATILSDILGKIGDEVTIWLDAHPIVDVLTEDNCPILNELNTIFKRHKKYKILIDDMRCFDVNTLEKIKSIASNIGVVSYETTKYGINDIMVIL